MDASRKRNVHMASGEDGVVDQTADTSFWQMESGPTKRFAGGNGSNNSSPAQSTSSMYLSLIAHQLQTQNTATAQSSAIPKRPNGPQLGQPGNMNIKTQKQSSQHKASQQNPFFSVCGDPNGGSSPHNFMSGSALPPHFPGQWDPASWWMLQAQQQAQAFYPFMLPGGGGGYPYSMPLPTPGMNQRGSIKVPPGLSQKHCQLWENQSSENVQIWTTITQMSASLARAEAEISCQRAKIIQLESALQSYMNQETVINTEDIPEPPKAPVMSQIQRKERGKRSSATGPVAIVCLPASQPAAFRQRGRKPKGTYCKVDHNVSQQDAVPSNEQVETEFEATCTNQQDTDYGQQPDSFQPCSSGTAQDNEKAPSLQNTQKELVKVKEENVYEESEHEKSRIDYHNSLVIYNAPPDPAKNCSTLALKESFVKDEIDATNCRAIVKIETDGQASLIPVKNNDSKTNDPYHQDDRERLAITSNNSLGSLLQSQSSNDTMRNAVGSSKVIPQWQFGINVDGQSNNRATFVDKDSMANSNDADVLVPARTNDGASLVKNATPDSSKWQFGINDSGQSNNGASLVENAIPDNSKWQFGINVADRVLVPGRSDDGASSAEKATMDNSRMADFFSMNTTPVFPKEVPSLMWRM